MLNHTYVCSLDGIPWTVPAMGFGRLITTIDLRKRNDSNLPNASPVAAVPPIIGIPFGCPTIITLPVEDPDADEIRTRVAFPDECGEACTSLPKYVIEPILGQLIVDTTSTNGYVAGMSYRVTLMIEDFPSYTITVGNEIVTPRYSLTKVPLQFTIKVIDDPYSCIDAAMKFVYPTVPNGFRISYPGFPVVGYFENAAYLESKSTRLTEYMTSVPGRMEIEMLPDDLRRFNVSRAYSKWNPLRDQSGDNILCVWGMKQNGITSEGRCVVGLINDLDGCSQNQVKCRNNGTCVNLWHRTTCKCPHGFKPRYCTERVTCLDFRCKNNGTCVDTGSQFICICAPGYTGVDCQTKVDKCVSTPCKHGVCIHENDYVSCYCYPGYTGSFCETEQPHAAKHEPEIWHLVFSFLVGAAALAAVATCCWWGCLCTATKRRKKDKKMHSISPHKNDKVTTYNGKLTIYSGNLSSVTQLTRLTNKIRRTPQPPPQHNRNRLQNGRHQPNSLSERETGLHRMPHSQIDSIVELDW